MLSDRLTALWIPIRSKVHSLILHSSLKELCAFDKVSYILQFINFLNTELIELEESKKINSKQKKLMLRHGTAYILCESGLDIPKIPKIIERIMWDYVTNIIIK